MGFIGLVKTCARADKKTVVLPESMDRRTREAVEAVLKEDVANLIIIGTSGGIVDHNKRLDVLGATVTNPQTYEKTQEYIDLFVELRKSEGMAPEKAREIIMSDYTCHGCLMIKNGDTDGLVPGACHSTTDALRPYLQVAKTEPGTKLVSTLFPTVVPDCECGADGTFVSADSGLNQNLNPEELAAITKSSADSFELLVQKEVRVAMLSHSTKGSAKYPDVDKVVEVTRIAEELYPELKLDGELQLDAALVPGVASSGAPGSEVVGKANILMFPDLDAGNIGYGLVQRLAKAKAYGPVTQRTAKPVNGLSRGCYAGGIAGVVAITAVQAQAEQAGVKGEISVDVLVISCGSLSLKYQLADSASEIVLVKGLRGKIGIEGSQITCQPAGGEKGVTAPPIPAHTRTIQMVPDVLINDRTGMAKSLDEAGAAGRRIVHGGEAFTAFTLTTEDAVKAIEERSDLAPLHNPANLIGIHACQELMPSIPMVGVFDTALHQAMPERVCLYGPPYEYHEEYKVRRYGFHGTSHSYVSKRTAEILGRPYDPLKTAICRLGNGSSIPTVLSGKSVDTGMGLTPLEGLVVGARSGDVDPGALQFIIRKEDMGIGQMLNVLNKKSGVYGTSGVSNDFHDVENAVSEGSKKAEAALESPVYRVAKHVGAYAAAMSGVDAIAFTAGAGENNRIIRKEVCGYLAFLGIKIDDRANSKRGQEVVISAPGFRTSVLAIPINEELAITRETLALVK